MTLGISIGSNPITGVYVGGTLATGVYFGGTKIWPAASGIVPVGSEATPQNAVFGSGVTSLTLDCTLPSGCAAGDVVVLTCSGQNVRSFTWVKPTDGTVALAPTLVGTTGIFAVYTYTLTSADVAAGTVGIPCTALASSTVGTAVLVDAYRTVSDVNLDVVGTLATGTASGSVADVTAPGFTTLQGGDLLQYSVCVGNPSGTFSVTPPSGWTAGAPCSAINLAFVGTGYLQQTSEGATGDITPSITQTFSGSYSYGVLLLSLRKKVSAITLSATFPSSPHVGDTVSFDVTATLVDGATGTLTITVDALPDGLTLGSTTDNGDGTFTATVSGALTTVQDITATFGTTGGSVSATPLVRAFDVSAAVSAATFVGANIFLSNSGHAPLPTGCQAGDWLFIAPTTNVAVTLSAPSSAASVIADMDFTLGSSHRHLAVWRYKLTATDITNGYVAITTNANRSQLVVARSSQATNPVDVSNTNSNSGSGTKPASVTVGGVTTTADGALLLLIDSVIPAGSATGTFAVSGWTVALTLNDALYKGGVAYLAQSTAGPTGDVTATFDNNNFASSGAALIAVKP